MDIPPGAKWFDSLADALATSCCLVPVWSASYFRSRYCLWEWETFRKRGERLVVPISWTKPKPFFPAEALGIQSHDFSAYSYPNRAYLHTEEGVGMQRAIRSFAANVARAIELAPPIKASDQRFQVADLPPAPAREKIPLMRMGAGLQSNLGR